MKWPAGIPCLIIDCGLKLLLTLALSAVSDPAVAQPLNVRLGDATALQFQNRDSSNILALHVLESAREQGNDSISIRALMLLANNAVFTGNNALAIQYFRRTLALNPEHDINTRLTVEAAARLAEAFLDVGQPDSAQVYAEIFDQLTELHQPELNAWPMILYGELYRTMDRRQVADQYYLKAISRAEVNNDTMGLTISLFYYLSDHLDSISTAKFLPYFERYLETTRRIRENRTTEYVHSTMLFGDMATEGQIELLKEAISIAKKEDRNPLPYQLMLTDILISQENLNEALAYAYDGLRTTEDRNDIGYIIDFHQRIASIYEQQGDRERAYPHLKIYYFVKDSVKDVEMARNLDALNIQYETAKKENELLEQARQIQRSRSQQNLLKIVMSGVLLFGGFLVYIFWNRSRLTSRIAVQERLIQEQRIDRLENEKKIVAMSAMMEGQEAERVRIARDLHDGLGGLLASAKAHFSAINISPHSSNDQAPVNKTGALLDQASAEVRRISHNMAPQALRLGSLRDALSDIASDANARGITVNFEWHGPEDRMEESIEITLYRIAQELVHNALKHSGASSLLLQINRYEGELNLLVEDNGKGFDSKMQDQGNGLGLKSLYARVDYLNGTMDIDSEPGQGTTTSIHVPLIRKVNTKSKE